MRIVRVILPLIGLLVGCGGGGGEAKEANTASSMASRGMASYPQTTVTRVAESAPSAERVVALSASPSPASGSDDNADAPSTPPSPPEPPQPPAFRPDAAPKSHDPADAVAHDKQMLVYTAQLNMAVYQVEPGLLAVEAVAKSMNGYLANRGDNQIEIRVPRERFYEALKRIEQTGDVIHRDIKAEDVTDSFLDMDARLRNAKAMRDRLMHLLDKAAVKEAIEIQKELGKVTEEIEVLEGKLKHLRDKIAFSTISVQYAPKSSAIAQTRFALPFPWVQTLGLSELVRLSERGE